MLTLYDYELSGNCYKVRLLLEFLGHPFERRPIDFHPGREHKQDWFLALNPLGQLPVIDDDGYILRDAQAILVYLASRYDSTEQWYPIVDPKRLGDLHQWLGFADALTSTAGAARLHDTLFYPGNITALRASAHHLLRVMDEHLWFGEQRSRSWLCSDLQPTIADIACFPYVMLCEEGGISRLPYPAVRRWTERFRRWPRFTLMSGVFPTAPRPAVTGT